jgi:hypothetical protein
MGHGAWSLELGAWGWETALLQISDTFFLLIHHSFLNLRLV